MANYTDDDELDDGLLDETEPGTAVGAGMGTAAQAAPAAGASPAVAGNRNFLLALGILGGVFLLLVIALVIFAMLRPQGSQQVADVASTNAVILAANTQTVRAVTEAAAALLTPAAPIATFTPRPTHTQVVVLPTAEQNEETAGGGQDPAIQTQAAEAGGGLDPAVQTETPGSVQTAATQTASVEQTVAAEQTASASSALSTATNAPDTAAQASTRTATVAVLMTQRAETRLARTQAAVGLATNTPGSPQSAVRTTTRLPQTGFAEDAGLPGLFGMAAGLVLLIVLVRRLRLANNS